MNRGERVDWAGVRSGASEVAATAAEIRDGVLAAQNRWTELRVSYDNPATNEMVHPTVSVLVEPAREWVRLVEQVRNILTAFADKGEPIVSELRNLENGINPSIESSEVVRRWAELEQATAAELRALDAAGIAQSLRSRIYPPSTSAGLPFWSSLQESPVPPPPTATPKEVAAWWASLDPAERTILLHERPELLGNRDGIPFAIRDAANRSMLDEYEAQLRDPDYVEPSLEGLVLPPGMRGDLTRSRREEKLRSIEALREVADRPGRRVLAIDLSGPRAQAVTAVGDLDTADYVAVHVPGFGTTVDGRLRSMDKTDERLATSMRELKGRFGASGDPSVAVVSYIGYPAPVVRSTLVPGASVLGPGAAETGGERLARFTDGIDAVRGGDAEVTVAGHSYGSVVAMYATRSTDSIDRLVVFGTPGVGSGRGLVDEGDAYMLEADNDPVADFGRFDAGSGDHIDATASPQLTQLDSGATQYGDRVTGHSDYLKEGSTSLAQIALVSIDEGEHTIRGYHYGAGDLIRDGAPVNPSVWTKYFVSHS